MSIVLLLVAVGVVAASGWPGLLVGRRSALGQWIATALNVIGSCAGGAALMLRTWGGGSEGLVWSWSLPGATLAVGVDDLSALFLVPMLLISALGSVYGMEYWAQRRHPGNGRKLRLWWGMLTAGMMGVVLARGAVVFLMAWEIMALSAYFLVGTEDHKPEVREAAWVYLVATHLGTLCLIACFALLRAGTGTLALWPAGAGGMPAGVATGVFITGLLGFGLKAGIVPLHVWLPGAHANAPSHVSAMLSGVLLKAGVYGIVRMTGVMPHPPVWWGGVVLGVGAVSGVVGIAYAAGQQDFKRLLAYSSIENIGIIMMGVGLALLGRATGHEAWVVLGMGGALLHVLNHSLFKPLMFMGAGSILHAARSRQMDLLGGLGKKMPRTFGLMLVGAVAICGLPPLNGFVGEFLIYSGLIGAAEARGGLACAAVGAPVLAIVGALAVATFVKLIGTVFLGSARSELAARGHEAGEWMIWPMGALAGLCVLIGVAPGAVIGLVARGVGAWAGDGESAMGKLAPIGWISGMGVGLVVLVAGGIVVYGRSRAAWPRVQAGTWDCGYARPTARIQYTGSSFAQMIVGMFRWVLAPRMVMRRPHAGALPEYRAMERRPEFATEVPDAVLDRGVIPAMSLMQRLSSWGRAMQRGLVQVYMLYVLLALLALLLLAAW